MSTLCEAFDYFENISSHEISKRDTRIVTKMLKELSSHSSGGTFDFISLWRKGSKQITGFNTIKRHARPYSNIYPDFCGVHAELDVIKQSDKIDMTLNGGTMYVVGVSSRSSNTLLNTLPCAACARMLADNTNINYIVCYFNGKLTRFKMNSIKKYAEDFVIKESKNDWVLMNMLNA